MQIVKTYSWNRRDFSYDAKCEHCGYIDKNNSGYDDDNYYNNVVPNSKCIKCGESSKSKTIEGLVSTVVVPRYDPNLVI